MLPATNADITRAPRDRRMCMAALPFERLRRRLFRPGRITNGISSIHDVIVAIDVKRLAGDETRGVVRQESGGDAHFVDAHQTARRHFRLGPAWLRLRPSQRRPRHTGATGLARPQEHPAHGALHRAVAAKAQPGKLEGWQTRRHLSGGGHPAIGKSERRRRRDRERNDRKPHRPRRKNTLAKHE